MTDEELKAAALRAIEESSQSWICNGEDADGVAVVYSPSLGPCREIVHVAETAPAFGPYIAAANPARILKLLAEQEEARTETGRLRAENIVLLKEAELLLDAVARLRKEVDAAKTEMTRLQGALWDYGRHRDDCDETCACACGWSGWEDLLTDKKIETP